MKFNRQKIKCDNTRTVVGARQYHGFLPISNTTLFAKKYSEPQDGSVVAAEESKVRVKPFNLKQSEGTLQ
jgi:hypothetical protein